MLDRSPEFCFLEIKMKPTHCAITIVDPERWGIKYGQKRKWNYQLKTDFFSDNAILSLSNDAKVLFLMIVIESLRVNKASVNMCLDHAYVLLNISLNDSKRVLNELEMNNIIDLQTKVRCSYRIEKNRIEKNRKEKVSHETDTHKSIIEYLNSQLNTSYKHTTKSTIKLIDARLNEDFTLDDFKTVIDNKIKEWKHDEHFSKYLRPETLFGTKFESYLNSQNKTVDDQKNELDEKLASMFVGEKK